MKPKNDPPAGGDNGGDKQQEIPKREFEYETPHKQPCEKGKEDSCT